MQEEEITIARFIKDSKQLTKIIARNEPVYVNCDQLHVLLGSLVSSFCLLSYIGFLSLGSKCGHIAISCLTYFWP